MPTDQSVRANASVAIVPAADWGSLGDEAMIQGLIRGLEITGDPVDGKRLLIGEHGDERTIPSLSDRAAEQLSFRLPAALRDVTGLRTFKRYLKDAKSRAVLRTADAIFVNGADVLDGRYGAAFSTSKMHAADLVSRRRRPATVTGFSFNETPHPRCVDEIKRIAPRVRLCARDPKSFARVREIAGPRVVYAADLAFLVAPLDEHDATLKAAEFIGRHRERGDVVLGLNLNSILGRIFGFGSDDEFVEHFEAAIGALNDAIGDRGVAVVGIPHDRRGTPNDRDLIARVTDRLSETRGVSAHMVDDTVPPGVIKAVCRGLDVLVTGRMHAAIAAFGVGTPSLPIDYQGKVEGLLEHLNLPECKIDAEKCRDSARLAEQIIWAVENRDRLAARLSSRLDYVRELAMRNVRSSPDDHQPPATASPSSSSLD